MTDSEKMDAILEAIPWRCFHCDFITSDKDEAAAHFGDTDDAEEFKPICKWWANMDEHERLEQLQEYIVMFNNGADCNMRMQNRIDGLEHHVNSQVDVIRGYKPFRKCKSIYDVFCVYDSMEGRALAAEKQLKELKGIHEH